MLFRTRRGDVIFAAVLTVALLILATLRLWKLDLLEFKGDEFTAILLTYAHVTGVQFALTGLTSSTGIPNPPFFLYLLSPVVAVTTNPVIVTGWIVSLNLLGIGILLWLFRRTFRWGTALLATVLFASSPWAFIFSRKIWAQNALLPFMAGSVFLLIDLKDRYRPWKVWLLALLLACALQLHMSVWFLLPGMAVFLLLTKTRIRIIDAIIGLGIGTILFSPFLVSLFFQGFPKEIGQAASGLTEPFGHLLWSLRLTTGAGFAYLLGDAMTPLRDIPGVTSTMAIFTLTQMIMVAGLTYILLRIARRSAMFRASADLDAGDRLLLLLLCMIVSLHVGFALFDITVWPHYHIAVLFALPLFFAVFVEELASRNGVVHWIARATVLCIIAANTAFTIGVVHTLEKHPQAITGDYGIPYRFVRDQWEAHRAEAMTKLQEQ